MAEAGVDDGGDAGTLGTLDAVARGAVERGPAPGPDSGVEVLPAHVPAWVDASEALGFAGEGGVSWRRAVEVFIVLFEGLEAGSFSSTRGRLRE